MKKTNYILASLLSIIIFYTAYASYSENEIGPFSFYEIEEIPLIELKDPHYLKASDGTSLAYYSFIPKQPIAVVVFYHGAGFYTNRSYQWVALELEQKYNIACYMIDVRGHGNSGGPRGDAPTIQQVWKDVDTIVEHVKHRYPNLPLYLAGHSSGSSLLINYNAHGKRIDDIDGYIFLAPYLGPQSETLKEHKNKEQNFIKKARTWVYIINSIIPWNFLQHIQAVFFNYPQSLLKNDPLIVSSYSYAMSSATTPYDIKALFAQLNTPFAIYIGENDEQFIPEKIVAYKKEYSIAEIIPNAKHLSILLYAPELIAKTIWRWKQ